MILNQEIASRIASETSEYWRSVLSSDTMSDVVETPEKGASRFGRIITVKENDASNFSSAPHENVKNNSVMENQKTKDSDRDENINRDENVKVMYTPLGMGLEEKRERGPRLGEHNSLFGLKVKSKM